MLVSDIVRRNADFYCDRDAVVVPGERTISWSQLEERTNRFGRALLSLGLQKGDRVATYAPNCGEYIDFFFACAKTGIIGATTNIRLAHAELISYLNYIEPSAIIVHRDLEKQAFFIKDIPSVKHIIGIGAGHSYNLDFESMLKAEKTNDPGCKIDETDIFQLGATSGTTGVPKGALLTHKNAIAAILNWMLEIPTPSEGTNMQNIPMFFNPGGPSGLHPVLMKGGRSVIFPAFEPGNFLKSIPEYKATNSILVPTMIGMVLSHPDAEKYDLSSLKGIGSGGSPISREMLKRARKVFGDVFYPMFGMAETYSSGMTLRLEDQYTEGTQDQVRRLNSAGKPQMLMQARVVDNDGNNVTKDNESPGELLLKGDSVSSGYFRMPEETKTSRDGEWLKTGDIAVMDNDGYITIVDRKKDVIITGGINVFSRDIEEAVTSHPAVAQAAAIGIPHEKWGEAIHCVVTLEPGMDAKADELISYVSKRVAGYKKPGSIDIVDSLPIGGTGKILKRELREKYWGKKSYGEPV
ncbi:MAG: AMP-binding protein [Desulfobacterales bacterium]|nr:AMP-binding protein [Desulfobacteraceae bacterium]MBT7697119.1 AMP-binding protein [Desulfobacterales bacterium]